MGHIRLGTLPQTRRWEQVVELVAHDGTAGAVAAAALRAAEKGFAEAAEDEGLGRAVWLLTQLPLAARDPSYLDRLRSLGIVVEANPGIMELVGAFTDAVDDHMRRSGGRTDFGEMAQMAAAETLTVLLGERSRSLFGTSAEDVQHAAAAFATTAQFSALAREFFGRLTRRFLMFFLSRELPSHVGGARRFASVTDHVAFDAAFDLHCRQASQIVEEFAGGWFSKANWEQRVTPDTARAFAWVALKKIRTELRKRGGPPR
jgi:hypothetical protein